MRRLAAATFLEVSLVCISGYGLAQDGSSPEGTWYLESGGQRVTAVIEYQDGLWGGEILGDDQQPQPVEVITSVEWYPESRRVVMQTHTSDNLWRWYRADIVEGVLKGRVSVPNVSPLQPSVMSFTGHVTGWNAGYLDRGITPRTFDLLVDNRYRARLRIDESPPGSGIHVGQMKVYATLDNGALDEGPEYDIQVSHWDGNLLQFHRGTTSDWQAFSGLVDGRHIAGYFFQSGTPEMKPWHGARAEVLGRGAGTGMHAMEVSTWQERLRRQLALLTMAGAPSPLSVTVNVLQSDLPPIPGSDMHPLRDDNPEAWPQHYVLDELEFLFELPNPYGLEPLVRRAHGYLARPTFTRGKRLPAALVLNGHGGSARGMMDPGHPFYWYGDAFARRGYIVLALDVSHRDYGDDPDNGNIEHPPIAAPGFTSDWEENGERTWTAMRAIDYLLDRDDVDPERLVVAGLSMGGEVSTLVGAMDTRVRATVASGYFPDLPVIRYRPNHPCWEWQWGDVTEYIGLADLHALVPPRMLVMQTGKVDSIYSFMWPPFASAKQAARRTLGVPAMLGGLYVHDLHPMGHDFRFGDVTVSGSPARGIEVPAVSGPLFPWDLGWQTDGQTEPLGETLFELLGWDIPAEPPIFSNGFEMDDR